MVKFYSAQALLGEVRDPQFTEAFAAIWLDPQTRSSALRQALLASQASALANGT